MCGKDKKDKTCEYPFWRLDTVDCSWRPRLKGHSKVDPSLWSESFNNWYVCRSDRSSTILGAIEARGGSIPSPCLGRSESMVL
jgi:hypothetical protein